MARMVIGVAASISRLHEEEGQIEKVKLKLL